MKTLADAQDKAELLTRLQKVGPDSRRRWGRMSPHQMVCHLSDSFRAVMGLRPTSPADNIFYRTIVKWIALYSNMEWPKGVPTRPEVDQEVAGTKPVEFQKDMADLEVLVTRFAAVERDFEWGRHPLFGRMTEREWRRWGYLHVDHHLRQFGA